MRPMDSYVVRVRDVGVLVSQGYVLLLAPITDWSFGLVQVIVQGRRFVLCLHGKGFAGPHLAVRLYPDGDEEVLVQLARALEALDPNEAVTIRRLSESSSHESVK